MGGRGNTGDIRTGAIKAGMSQSAINKVTTRLSVEKKRITTERDEKINSVSQKVSSGKLDIQTGMSQINKITDDYNKKLKKLQSVNKKLSDATGVFVAGI